MKKGIDITKARWAQKTHSEFFSEEGTFAGKTISNVVSDLKSGAIKSKNVPIDVIVRNGVTFILNTRSFIALTRAGITRNKWTIINRTGNLEYELRLTNRLKRNNLTNGTMEIRSSGGGN